MQIVDSLSYLQIIPIIPCGVSAKSKNGEALLNAAENIKLVKNQFISGSDIAGVYFFIS